MFHRDERFYPAASICLAIASIAFALWYAVKADAAEIVDKDGKVEKAICVQYWTEPVTIICRSETQTCRYYPETGQLECIQK